MPSLDFGATRLDTARHRFADTKFAFNLRFPGQYFDVETGTSYNYHRTYDAALGRYIQSDPVGLYGKTLATYGYVDGNPLVRLDPDGTVIRLITLCGKGYKVVREVGWKEAIRMAREGKAQLKGDSRAEMKKLAKAASKGEKPIHHPGGHDPYGNPHFHPGPHPGKGGHLFYSVLSGLTFSGYVEGCGCVAEKAAFIADLFNPLAAGKDIYDLVEGND